MGQLKHLLFQDMLMALNEGTAILRDGKAVVDFLESMVGTVIAKRRLTILGAQLTEATVRRSSHLVSGVLFQHGVAPSASTKTTCLAFLLLIHLWSPS